MSEEISATNQIIAIITENENKDKVSGGVPIFFTANEKETEEVSALLARATLGMVHDLGNGINIIIKH